MVSPVGCTPAYAGYVVTCLVIQQAPTDPTAASPSAMKTLIMVPWYYSISVTFILIGIEEGPL